MKLLSGSEAFSSSVAVPPPAQLRQFWAWYSSDLMGNALRGALAEYIVALALGIRLTQARESWGACDLVTEDGINVEVKCSAYLQSWNTQGLSRPRFGCGPSESFDGRRYDGHPAYHSDVYVFCLETCQDRAAYDALNLDQWAFYIALTRDVQRLSQQSVSLASLERFAVGPVRFHEISGALRDLCRSPHDP